VWSKTNYAGCGEPARSISQGTGASLVKDRCTDGHFYHLRCLAGELLLDAHWSCWRGWATSVAAFFSLAV
jgi:hypothetical protein